MDDVHPMLQGGGDLKYDEAELAFLETSSSMDKKHLAFRYSVVIYGARCLDKTSLRRVYDGGQADQSFHASQRSLFGCICHIQEHETC